MRNCFWQSCHVLRLKVRLVDIHYSWVFKSKSFYPFIAWEEEKCCIDTIPWWWHDKKRADVWVFFCFHGTVAPFQPACSSAFELLSWLSSLSNTFMRRHPARRKKWGKKEVSQQLLKQGNEYGHDDSSWPFTPWHEKSLNYIKQLRLKEDLCLSRGFSMETLRPHEYDIPVVTGDHLEGAHVLGFLIHAFPSEIWSQT